MVDYELLNDKIRDSGMTMVAIAKKSGILRETLYNKIKGSGEFKASEIFGLSNALKLTTAERDRIFFVKQCERRPCNGGENRKGNRRIGGSIERGE